MYFDFNFTEICSKGSSLKKLSIGSAYGLTLTMQQVITWNNTCKFQCPSLSPMIYHI